MEENTATAASPDGDFSSLLVDRKVSRTVVSHRTDASAKFQGRDARGETELNRERAGGGEEVM